MNSINVGTSKVSTGYKGSQNTDYIILGQTIVNTNKTYPCAKEGSLQKATLQDLLTLPYVDTQTGTCHIYFSKYVNTFKFRLRVNNLFDSTIDCDIDQQVDIGYGWIINKGNYCIVAGMTNLRALKDSDIQPGQVIKHDYIFGNDTYEYILEL